MAKKRRRLNRQAGLLLPHLLLRIFVLASLFLVPWTVFMSQYLPAKHLDHNWNIAWVGFDIGLLTSLLMTYYFGLRRSGWVVATSASAGTFLLIDAWFDCLTAKNGWESLLSLSTAAVFELPLAILAFWVTYHSGHYYFKSSSINNKKYK
jgi:hypothetical protein